MDGNGSYMEATIDRSFVSEVWIAMQYITDYHYQNR